jgi:putative phosphoesterase
MFVGIFSDIHDHMENLKTGLSLFKQKNVASLVFCGDFCSPIPAKFIASSFNGNVHCVFGNGDGDRMTIQKFAFTDHTNLVIHGEWAEIDFENRKVAVTHYPFYAYAIAQLQKYDAVFYGHNHISKVEIFGKTICVNPGDVMGFKNRASVAIYNTENNQVDMCEL